MPVTKSKSAPAAAAYKNKRETVFKFKKETTGAIQYEEVNENGSKRTDMDGAVCGSLYIRKATLRSFAAPDLIKATFEW